MNMVKKYRLVLLRSCGVALVGLIIFSADQCNAQLIRGRWQRLKSVDKDVHAPGQLSVRSPRQPLSNTTQSLYPTNRFSERWGRPNPLNVQDNDARYIGGLHHTYFENLGIPPGDIGLRGNGVFWRPW
ncbi:MAG: hypothetical protein GY880_15310 [Planctomycetaceae bacterium]|nr:hypothetical protein [Planctomycetaceae bacterium]MCP4775600.1 hypothetical protein [Planctomycetaceae bacterium]